MIPVPLSFAVLWGLIQCLTGRTAYAYSLVVLVLEGAELSHRVGKGTRAVDWFLRAETDAEGETEAIAREWRIRLEIRRNDQPIYLDYQATTPLDPRVLEAMLPFFTERFGNPHSKQHAFGWDARDATDEQRDCGDAE